MPNSVDNKIVEMQFDNANFEKNVKQSIKTLEALNKALELEDAAKGFEQMEAAANSIDLSKLTRAAEVIEKRFSAAGIAGAAVITRVVNGAINSVTNLGKTVVGLAKTGGINRALNLEHANFMLQGILKDSELVAKIISGPVNNAVSGTAYGLDAAANAAAQFVASGVTDMKKLENALTGISGVAAMTGAEYAEIADIFTSVAGKGKAMTMELNRIAQRGVNAKAAIADFLNTTEAEVAEMAKKGQISFEIFSEAMNEAFGEQAKKANETFTGAMSNVRAALSRIGAKVAQPAIEALRKVFVSLIKVINQVNTILSSTIIKRVNAFIIRLEALAVGLLNQKKFMTLLEKVVNNLAAGFELLLSIIRPVKAAFRAIFPRNTLDTLIAFNDNLSDLIEKLTLSDEKAAMLQMTFQGLFAVLDIMLTLVKQVLSIFIPGMGSLYDASDSLSTKILNITSFIGFLLTKLDDWLKKNNLIKAAVNLLTGAIGGLNTKANILKDIVTVIATVIGGVAYIFYKIGEAVWSFLKKVYELPAVQLIIGGIKDSIIRLGDLAIPILGAVADSFVSLLDSLENFAAGDYLNAGLNKLNDVLNTAYWGFTYAIDAVKGFFGLFNKSAPVADRIETVAVASEKLYASAEQLTGPMNGVTKSITRTTEAIDGLEGTTEKVATNVSNDMNSLKQAEKLFSIGFGAAIISASVNVARAFRNIGKVTKNIGGITKSIKLFFDQLNLNLRIKTLFAFAGAVVVLAGALALLTRLDPIRLLVASAAITILTVAMYKLAGLMSTTKTTDVAKFKLAAKGLLEFSTALLVLAAAARLMSTYVKDWGTFAANIGSLIVTMYAMAGAIILIGRFQKNAIKGASAMLAFGGSIYLVMSALSKIQTLDLDKIADAIPLMLEIVAGMVAVGLAMSLTISPFGGLSFMGIAVGIALLFDALQMAAALDPKVLYQVEDLIDEIGLVLEHIVWALAALQLLSTIEAALTFATRKIIGVSDMFKGLFLTAEKGLKYIGIASIIVALAAAIYMIGETVIRLSALTLPEIAQGGVVVAAIAIAVTAMSKYIIGMAAQVFVAEQAGRKIGEGLLGISAALLAFTLAIQILSDMDIDLFYSGAGKLVIVGVMLLAFMKACQYIDQAGALATTSFKSAGAIALLIGMMTVALGLLAFIPYEDLYPAIEALAVMLGGLYLVFLGLSKMANMSTQATVAVFGIAAVFGVLGGVMYLLKDCVTANVFANLATLELAVLGMGLILKALSNMQENLVQGEIALAAITGVLLGLSAVGFILNMVNPVTLTANLVALSAAVIALTVIVSALGTMQSMTADGTAVLIFISAAFVILAGAAAILNQVNPEQFSKNVDVLAKAVLILSLAVGILGALGESGIGVIGAIILIAIAGAMVIFSAAAQGFGQAAVLAGQGLTLVSSALSEMKDIPIASISLSISSLAVALFTLTAQVPGLILTAASLAIASAGFAIFGAAITAFSAGLTALSSVNLTGVMANMIMLGQAMEFVNQRALEFGLFATIALAVGGACFVMGAGLTAAGIGLGVFGVGLTAVSVALNVAIFGFNLLAAAIERIGNVIVTITERFNTMLSLLTQIGGETIMGIIEALMEFGSTQLVNAGQSLVIYLKQGWDQMAPTATEEMVNDFVDDLIYAIESKDTAIYNAFYSMFDNATRAMYDAIGVGEENVGVKAAKDTGTGMVNEAHRQKPPVGQAFKELGETADENVREPLGAYCEGKTGVEVSSDTGTGMINEAGRQEPEVGKAFNSVGNTAGSGLWNGIKNWLSGVGEKLKNFWSSIKNGSIFENGYSAGDLGGVGSLMDEYKNTMKKLSGATGPHIRLNDGTSITWKQYNDARKQGRDALSQYMTAAKESADATDAETEALEGNSGATGKSSKAKKENAKANEKKTKEIKEETDALDEESEAVEENTVDYQALAEEIEVVTEKFDENLNWIGHKDKFKVLKSLTSAMSNFWSTVSEDPSKIGQSYNELSKGLTKTTDRIARGTYFFKENGKIINKLTTDTMLSSSKIKKSVEKTGRTVIKVFEGQMKVFTKNQNGIEKFTLALPKATKNLSKFAKEAKNFANSMNGVNANSLPDSKSFIDSFRGIEKYFTTLKTMPKQVSGFMKSVWEEMKTDFGNSMNILGKNIDGIGSIMSKNSRATAYVEDAFISLAATLYDGSEAANEYATEHARLLFLLEHGEATEEEVAEHERSYIKRITEALLEYKNALTDTLSSQMDIWKAFDKGTIEGGADTLIKNIESQIAGYENWGNMLMELSKRGVDANLMKALTDEGVASYGKLEAMLSMTREQLALFNQDFKTSQKMIDQTANTALAAMANATNRASQRAAAQKGDKVAQAQLKKSKKTAQEMQDEYKAVAAAVVSTDKITKKQEKEYLKTLTKAEKKAYKKAKADYKRTEAEEKAIAETERAKRAEEERLQTVLDSIKTFDDYVKVMVEYNKDASVMSNITTKMSEAFKDMGDIIGGISVSTGSANEALMMFGETLDATGTDGLNYFEELAARVQKFTDEIKDAIKGTNLLTTAFGSAEKISLKDIYENNILSNITGNATTNDALSKLATKGYNSYVLKDVIDTFKSDRARGLELMNQLNDANADYVGKINAAYEAAYQDAQNIANKATSTIASGTSKAALENNIKYIQTELDGIVEQRKAKEAEIASYQAELDKINAEKQAIANEKARKKELKKILKDNGKLTKAQEKEYIKLLKKYGGTYNGVAYKTVTAATDKLADNVTYYTNLINQAQGEVNGLIAKEQERTRALADAQNKLNAYNAELKKYIDTVREDAKIKAWFDVNITSIDAMSNALKKFATNSKELTYLKGKIAEVMDELNIYATDASGIVKENSIGFIFDAVENFASIKSMADESNPFTTLEDGILRFGESLVDATTNAEDFYTTLKEGLIDYQKELKNTIASSSDFFSMFEPDTDKTANDYLEYADSQISALETWSDNLKKLADKGLDKELLEKFASQGLSSYEQVNAWVNATAQQIGEYNDQWKRYNETVESAANSAMASIAAAWSTAGQSLQDSMISSFLSDGAERLKNTGYEASAMVITGIQDGLTNAMPTIISAIEKSAKTTTMASAIGKEVGESINTGLVQAISSTVTDTVNSAVEKFKMAVNSINSYVQDTLPTEYTITIHVDTSEFDDAIARMNAAISGTNVQANQTASAVTQSNENRANNASTTEPVSQVTNNVTFNQTNTSPKALSQVDIYRNTQNQLNDYRVKLGLGG